MTDQERIYAEQIIALLQGIKSECRSTGNIAACLFGLVLAIGVYVSWAVGGS